MKASFPLGTATKKGLRLLAFIPVMAWVFYPVVARAAISSQLPEKTAQVFEVKVPIPNPETNSVRLLTIDDLKAADPQYQFDLAYKEQLQQYLSQRGSPLADCVDQLVDAKNSDKILSLANAESGLGAHFPAQTNNLWGVGGGRLWKMGNTVCEAVEAMDGFLSTYPRNATVKYDLMPIEKMNGLYKQPARLHWLNNNRVILQDLVNLKNQALQTSQERITQGQTGQHMVAISDSRIELARN